MSGNDFEVKITGLPELRAQMDALSGEIQTKGGRFALRKAANVIADAARANAMKLNDPETNEQISANIVANFSPKMFRRTGDLMFRIGVLGGAKQYANTKHNVRKRRVGASYKTLGDAGNPGGDTWYWRFLEFGTKARPPRAARQKRGRTIRAKRGSPARPAQPLLRDAMNRKAHEALNVFSIELKKVIMRSVRRQAKQSAKVT